MYFDTKLQQICCKINYSLLYMGPWIEPRTPTNILLVDTGFFKLQEASKVQQSIQYCNLYCHPESENTPGLRSDREAEWAKSDHLVGLLPPATELDDQFFCWFLCQPLLLNLKKRHFITSILILLFCVLQPNLPVLLRINVKTMSF